MRLWVCDRCEAMWGAPLVACPHCRAQLRPVDRRDASHPVLARFPARALPAPPADPGLDTAVVSVAAPTAVITGRGRRRPGGT